MVLWIIIIASVLIDQGTKLLISNTFELGETHVLIKGVLNFTYIRNEGAAWGIFSDSRWVFIAITAVMLVVLPLVLYKYRKLHFLFGFSLSLIIGGAAGNMIDRVFQGSVVDFIQAAFIDFPIFNFADCCVTVGAALMFIYLVFIDKTLFKSKKDEEDPAKAVEAEIAEKTEVKNENNGDTEQ
ncbi:MAG: signal peptidase II [Clostridia bacterium]|nr:signal peptidase II [Clostridia bacterium]